LRDGRSGYDAVDPMSIQSLSFWQLDQNFWNQNGSFYQQDQNSWSQSKAESQASAASTSLINVMGAAESNLAKGLASIANATALHRVNSQITALVEQVLGENPSSSSGSTGTAANSSSSSGNTSTSGAPATGIGKVPLTTSTSLATLGILSGGTITVGTGANITTYTSTGTDTVADLLNAINLDLPTNANVTASLDATGRLVITSRDKTSAIFVGGSGTDAAAIGFGAGNNTFLPKAASGSSTSSSSSQSSASSAAGSAGSTSSSKNASKSTAAAPTYPSLASLTGGTAASILSADGASGNLVDLLA
jgi:hypothetical protein